MTELQEHEIDIIQCEPKMQSREKGEGEVISCAVRLSRREEGDSEAEQREGLALPAIISVPDNSPAPLESTSVVCIPTSAASRFDTVEKLGTTEYL